MSAYNTSSQEHPTNTWPGLDLFLFVVFSGGNIEGALKCPSVKLASDRLISAQNQRTALHGQHCGRLNLLPTNCTSVGWHKLHYLCDSCLSANIIAILKTMWHKTCDTKQHVTQNNMRHKTTCDTKQHVTQNSTWHKTARDTKQCDTKQNVTQNRMWHKTACDTKQHVTQNSTWHKTECDTKENVTQNSMWHKTARDTKQHVTQNSTWHKTARDKNSTWH